MGAGSDAGGSLEERMDLFSTAWSNPRRRPLRRVAKEELVSDEEIDRMIRRMFWRGEDGIGKIGSIGERIAKELRGGEAEGLTYSAPRI